MKSFLASLVLSLVLAACAVDGPMAPSQQNGILQTKQWCDTHPAECPGAVPDPDSTAPGFYIGSDLTYANCSDEFLMPGGDVDQDGFGDVCEHEIASYFSPQLKYGSYDADMGRQTYWAVRPTTGDYGYGGAVIFYALGYYKDGGSFSAWCAQNLLNDSCAGHWGDSEFVVIRVNYNATSNHWELAAADYSQHGNSITYSRSELEYPLGKNYTYPNVHVALGKHANYKSDAACDAGAVLNTDTCQGDLAQRVTVSAYRNLGQNAVRTINCVSLQQGGYAECFWTAAEFTGWSGASNPSKPVAGYKTFLIDRYFF